MHCLSLRWLSTQRTVGCKKVALVLMLADRMADSLSKEGIIADEEKGIVQFGLESQEGNLLGIVLTLAVGFCFNLVGDALLLWLLLFPLRKNAGGFFYLLRFLRHLIVKLSCKGQAL